MENLSELKCTVCRSGDAPLERAEIHELLPQVPAWQLMEEDGVPRLRREFRLADYPATLAFTQAVGAAAEEAGHHPVLLIEWGQVTVTWWTHKIKGLHRNDFVMAARCDRIYGDFSGKQPAADAGQESK